MSRDQKAADTILLRAARIIGVDRVIESANVLIEHGRISRISETDSLTAPDATVVDLHGLTLWPGFIDVHIHGAAGIDTMQSSAEDLARVSQFLAGHGVTAWLPTLVPSSPAQYQHAIDAIAELMRAQHELAMPSASRRDETPAIPANHARVLGVHYEGPFVNVAQCGALHREHFRVFESIRDLETLPAITGNGAVHLMTLAPEIDGGIELIRELNQRRWVVSIGHTRADLDVLDRALQAGARHMTHFMNAMPALHHRSPGPVGWGLLNDAVTCDLIADGIHIDPMILKLILGCKTGDRVALISDAIAPAGLGDGEYQIWGETINVENGRTRNARGNIAGSVITMLDAVRLMLSLGASQPDVAKMASLNPARLLGIDGECGSIEEGKRADLVGLDAEKNVRFVMIGGRTQS